MIHGICNALLDKVRWSCFRLHADSIFRYTKRPTSWSKVLSAGLIWYVTARQLGSFVKLLSMALIKPDFDSVTSNQQSIDKAQTKAHVGGGMQRISHCLVAGQAPTFLY